MSSKKRTAASGGDVDELEEQAKGLSLVPAGGEGAAAAPGTDGAGAASAEGGVTASIEGTDAQNADDMREKDEMLRLLKQPSLTEMAMAAVRQHKAAGGEGGAGGGGTNSAAALASAFGKGPSSLKPILRADGSVDEAATYAAAAAAQHRFWDTQPVPKLAAEPVENGPLEADKPRDQVRQEAYPLPAGFEWCTVDITDEGALREMYELLCENYVEDDDNMFRFNYGREFLLWALTPPGFLPDWIVGVRFKATGRLMACITGVPATLRVYDATVRNCEINFLCIHKKLRAKRLAPVLIKEVTRRVNLAGVFQAAYTAGVVLPKPVASCRYWHRSLQPKKLIEVGFSRLAPRMTLKMTQKLYALPDTPKIGGLRPMEPRHVASACGLLNDYLRRTTTMHPLYTPEEFAHWLLPREGVIDTFVVEADEGEGGDAAPAPSGGGTRVTDMISFYHLPSTVIGNDKHKILHAVYSFYYVPGRFPLAALMEDALILAKARGVDVFNCLDLMENGGMLEKLKFGQGDGNLQYYLFNWQCPSMDPKAVGLVLL